MPKRKLKKPRGSRGERTANFDGSPSEKDGGACDLMITLPKSSSKLHDKLQLKQLIDRLTSTGFTHIAVTHIIYGRPRSVEDKAATAIPEDLLSSSSSSVAQTDSTSEQSGKRRKSDTNPKSLKVLRRLHAVLENLSDVGLYLSNSAHMSLLNEYDLISVAPRNEAAFQSVCASATMADIITLDYGGSRGLKLPYKIRPADVQAVIDRNAAFEIPFAPALLNSKLRKALVQACRELQSACLGKGPLIIFSSGDRTFEESDVGAMALRMPGDLSNMMQVVLHFDPTTSSRAVSASAHSVLKRADTRRWGKSDVGSVSIGPKEPVDEKAVENDDQGKAGVAVLRPVAISNNDESSDGNEDGFISIV